VADPRLAVSHKGAGYLALPFIAGGTAGTAITYSATASGGCASVGLAVTLSAANTVALVADGGAVLGKLLLVESDGVCTVQVKGSMTLPGGTGASLTLGKKIVGAVNGSGADGYIREVATATAAELGVCKGEILDAGTTTAVEVLL
jgi:hypothetical protein